MDYQRPRALFLPSFEETLREIYIINRRQLFTISAIKDRIFIIFFCKVLILETRLRTFSPQCTRRKETCRDRQNKSSGSRESLSAGVVKLISHEKYKRGSPLYATRARAAKISRGLIHPETARVPRDQRSIFHPREKSDAPLEGGVRAASGK